MPSFIDGHSDEIVASNARAGHCDAHAHLRQLHPHEQQQQNKNIDDQDIVHKPRTYGNAIVNTSRARVFAERPNSLSSLCIAPLSDRHVEIDDELVGIALCGFGVCSCTWCVFARFVFTFSA